MSNENIEKNKKKDEIFNNLVFFTDTHRLLPKKHIEKLVSKYGGKVVDKFSKKIDYFISIFENFDSKTELFIKAQKMKLKIVSLNFLIDSICNDSLNPKNFDISNFKKDDTNTTENKFSNEKKTIFMKRNEKTLTMITLNINNKKKLNKKNEFKTIPNAEKAFLKKTIQFIINDFKILNEKKVSNIKYKPKESTIPSKRTKFMQKSEKTQVIKETKISDNNINLNENKNKKSKFIRLKEFRKKNLELGDKIIDVNSEEFIYKNFYPIKKLLSQHKTNQQIHKKVKKFEKKVFENKDQRFELVRHKNLIFFDIFNKNSNRKTKGDIFIKQKYSETKSKFNELIEFTEKKANETKKHLNNNEIDQKLLWWKNSLLTQKILEKNRLFIFERIPFESFKDFESLEDIHYMNQIEVALINSGLLAPLIDTYCKLNRVNITYQQLTQKYFSVKLLFEIGYLIGFILGDLIKFYYFPKKIENENEKEKLIGDNNTSSASEITTKKNSKLMTMISFEYDDEKNQKNKITGFVFNEDSLNIKFCLDNESGNKKNPFIYLKKALMGEADIVI